MNSVLLKQKTIKIEMRTIKKAGLSLIAISSLALAACTGSGDLSVKTPYGEKLIVKPGTVKVRDYSIRDSQYYWNTRIRDEERKPYLQAIVVQDDLAAKGEKLLVTVEYKPIRVDLNGEKSFGDFTRFECFNPLHKDKVSWDVRSGSPLAYNNDAKNKLGKLVCDRYAFADQQ